MRRLATSMLGFTALLCTVATAFAVPAKYPPGPPYRSCPGDPTPYTVQNPDTLANPCYPVIGDTVVNVRGVIIGFDAKPSAYAVYFQNSAGGPFSGVQAFTGATNYNAPPYSLALGDSISVTGTCQEFPNPDGTTEIEGPDVIQSTNDIIINKISSNNALPAFKILTPTQINWIPGVSQGEQWEATLVRVKGPLKVVRRVTSGTLAGLTANTFLLKLNSVPDGTPTDSIMIDGNTLTTFTPPALNTVIDSIQGIVNQGNGGTVNSYRIQLRDADDIYGPFPPGLADAYCIEDNRLRLIFDRKVDIASAQNVSNYSLASGIDGSTVDAAVVELPAAKSVRLNITTVRNHGDVETVSAVGIGSAACPTCVISPQQSRTFIQGVLSCAEVQAPLAANLPLYDDRSRFAGTGTLPGNRMTVRGVGTGQYATLQYIGDAGGGFRAGVSVFGPLQPLVPGRKFRIAGNVQEFGGETEVVGTVEITDEGAGTMPPATLQTVAVLTDTTTDKNQNTLTGEDYEGVLVKVSYVKVTENRTIGQGFFAAGPNPSFTDTILVSNLNGVLNSYVPPDSNSVCDITGILHMASGTFRICPRDPSDIVVHGHNVGVPPPSELSFSVAPNPASKARISFVLPRATNVSLGVFDLQGRQVASLASGRLPAGSYTKEWRPSASQMKGGSGVYFYRLKAGSETRVVRGVIIN